VESLTSLYIHAVLYPRYDAEIMVRQSTTPEPEPATLTGVGVGPGDPEFVTLAALRVLDEADLILGPTSIPGQPGRAETIIRSLRPALMIRPILFQMSPGRLGIEERRQSTLGAAQEIAALLVPGSRTAFLTLGDPNVFSTFNLLAEMITSIEPAIVVNSIPGIMAFQAIVSACGVTLLNESERLSLLTGLEVSEKLEQELADPTCAVVIYKGGRNLRQIAKVIESHGRSSKAIIGISTGMANGSIASLAETTEIESAPYLSTIIVPPERDPGVRSS
jgi:precorrin-2/cobalt-factor-2 C20-methyltransferase